MLYLDIILYELLFVSKVKFYPLASKLCFRQLVLVARSDRAKRFHLPEVAQVMQQFL